MLEAVDEPSPVGSGFEEEKGRPFAYEIGGLLTKPRGSKISKMKFASGLEPTANRKDSQPSKARYPRHHAVTSELLKLAYSRSVRYRSASMAAAHP